MTILKTVLALSVCVAALYPTGVSAQAQVSGQPSESTSAAVTGAGSALGDIVVTARRRSENSQNVPISITSANATALATARVDNISNVAAITPSVAFKASNISTSTANIIIRGLGTTGNSRSFEGSVGVFVDGVYRTRAAAALQNFLDIDNLQILRGPQGTLFGKNTTAGAVLLTSAAPSTKQAQGLVDLSYGNYNTVIARAAGNIPISDKVAFRVAGLASTRDGFYVDPNTGNSLNGDSARAVKAQLLLKPSDDVSIRLIGDYSRSSGNCCYATSQYINGPVAPLIAGLTAGLGLKSPSSDLSKFQSTLNHTNNQLTEDYGGTMLADFSVGSGSIKSVTALRQFDVTQTDTDPDFSGADIFSLDESFASRFFSQELTYNGKINALNADFVLGAFYSDEKLNMTRSLSWGLEGQTFWDIALNAQFGFPAGTVYAAPGRWASEAMTGNAQSYAAFAHFDAKIGSNVNLIAGLRYSIEHKEGSFRNTFYRPQPNDVFRALGLQPGPAYDRTTTDKALSGTFGLQYRPVRNVMIYATYNRGFKAGGVNIDANAAGTRLNNPTEVPGAIPQSPVYKPETVNAFELGVKTEYFNHRARTNFSAFYYDLSNLQVAQFIGLQFTVLNAKSATDYGLEIENIFKLTSSVTLGLDATYVPHAAYAVDSNIDPVLSGSRFRYAPKFQGNANVTIDQPIASDLNLTGRVQYQYKSSEYISTASKTTIGSVGLVNANLGLRFPKSGLSIEGWVQNLTNKTYPTYGFNVPLQTGSENVYLGAPRTYGVHLRATF